MPMAPAVEPNASATRLTFSAHSPGARMLTTRAAVISAMKALMRITTIMPSTVAMPMKRISSG